MTDIRPTVGSDRDTWGSKLLTWLGGSVDVDGTLKAASVRTALGGSLSPLTGAVGDGVTDDTAAIQAILTAAPNWIRGTPGKNYVISSPLVVSSNTILDMRDCTITLKAGSNCNMLNNTALASARTVLDGAITSGLNVLTSATAAFVPGDVGKAVTVVGADSTGGRRLVTTISGYTNATTVTLTANAGTTVTNAWITIGTRDTNIVLLGGLWDRGANTAGGTFGYLSNSIRLRRVDGLRCYGVQGQSTAGKYLLNPGDCWDFKVEDTRALDHFSDVVHINGPARHGTIRDTYADHAGDDIVSLTCADFHTFASMDDTVGDISDVLIDGVRAAYGGRRAAIGIAGSGRTLSRVTYKNIGGEYANSMLAIGGDYQDAATQGGTYTSILVDNVKADPGSSPSLSCLLLTDGTYDDVTARNLFPDAGMQSAVVIGGTQTNQNPTIETLSVDGAYWTGGTTGQGMIQLTRGTLNHVIGANLRVVTANTGVSLFRAATTQASSVARISLSNCRMQVGSGGNTSSIVQCTDSSTTLTYVQIANVYTKNVTYPLARYASSVTVEAANIICEGASAIARVDAAGTVTIYALNVSSNAYNVSTGGGTILWASEQEQVVTDTYSSSITPIAQAGRVHLITVTNGTAFTINAPTSPPPATGTQDLTIEILNSSGGAMGLITWNAVFIFTVGAWTNPASTKKRSISFRWNGTQWIQQTPVGTDY